MKEARYTAAAIVLHWAIALAIISNLAIAQWMEAALGDAARQASAVAAYQIHKSIGLTVLALSVLRLGLRWIFPPPGMPAGMSLWQRGAAHATHVLLYVLMIGIPLSGWLLVSTQWRDGAPLVVPTLWFGIVEVPHLFGLEAAADSRRDAVYGDAVSAHMLLARMAFVLVLLHVAAAIKHQWIDRDGLLARMAPWSQPSDSPTQRWSL
ncbi:MAG: cytochrome b, partial [Pseudomonadota bacterium]